MKITIDMDISPEEARKLMGFPDLEPLQNAMMEKLQSQMEEYFSNMSDPEAMLNKFMPLGVNAMEQYKNFFTDIANTSYENQKAEN